MRWIVHLCLRASNSYPSRHYGSTIDKGIVNGFSSWKRPAVSNAVEKPLAWVKEWESQKLAHELERCAVIAFLPRSIYTSLENPEMGLVDDLSH